VAAALKARNILSALAAALATGYLVLMVVVGALPEQRQFVKFEAKGVMQIPPERIGTVALRAGQRSAVFTRTPDGGWARDNGAALDPALAKRLSLAVQFMNTAGPIRVIPADEIPGIKLADFGLEPPRLHVVLSRDAQAVIGVRFGSHNPEDTAQYLTVDGHGELILMSRFVGQEWESVAGALFTK